MIGFQPVKNGNVAFFKPASHLELRPFDRLRHFFCMVTAALKNGWTDTLRSISLVCFWSGVAVSKSRG